MKTPAKAPPQQERYKQRINTSPIVKEALIKEQGRRQGQPPYKRVPVKELLTEWLEEKARQVMTEE